MKRLLIVAVAAMVLAACSNKPMYLVTDHPVTLPAQSLSMEQLQKAVIAGAQTHGWRVEKMERGRVRVIQQQPKYAATVDIVYNQKTFSIVPVSTVGLKEKDGTVHYRYNRWIENLERDVEMAIGNQAISRPAS